MWYRVSKWLAAKAAAPSEGEADDAQLSVGQRISLNAHIPVTALQNQGGELIRERIYRFGEDEIRSFILKLDSGEEYSLSLLHDSDIRYASISRELSTAERRQWFDPDALSFFLEKTSAQTLRCRAPMPAESAWAAERYVKTVDLVEASMQEIGKRGQPTALTYSMLLDTSGEKAIEIEQYGDHGLLRMYTTIFIPLYALEISALAANEPAISPRETRGEPPLFLDVPLAKNDNQRPSAAKSSEQKEEDEGEDFALNASAQILPLREAFEALTRELETMAEEEISAAFSDARGTFEASLQEKPEFKNDFRRKANEVPARALESEKTQTANVPEFLLKPREEAKVSASSKTAESPADHLFKKIFEPKASQILCDVQSASVIEREAAERGVSTQDLLRTMIGLRDEKPAMHAFELSLSEEDYRKLAMRYQLRPDRREEIRKRMSEELASAIRSMKS